MPWLYYVSAIGYTRRSCNHWGGSQTENRGWYRHCPYACVPGLASRPLALRGSPQMRRAGGARGWGFGIRRSEIRKRRFKIQEQARSPKGRDAGAGAMLFPGIPLPARELRYTEPMATIDIAHLSLEERLRLLDELWESLSRTAEAIPLTGAQRAELDLRLDELEREGPTGIPWEDVLRQIRGWRRHGVGCLRPKPRVATSRAQVFTAGLGITDGRFKIQEQARSPRSERPGCGIRGSGSGVGGSRLGNWKSKIADSRPKRRHRRSLPSSAAFRFATCSSP